MIPIDEYYILVKRDMREVTMERRVDRVFIVLLVIFSVAFVILSAFLRSNKILGFSGDYWAGILCVGITLIIMGWGLIMWLRRTRG